MKNPALPGPGQRLFFAGAGGAGVSPLAIIAHELGFPAAGSDLVANAKTRHLQELGIPVAIGHAAGNLPDDTALLVYSSAVPADNPERQKAAGLALPQLRRGEFLGLLSDTYARTCAVSGSHGKSSITAMLVHLLVGAGRHPGFLIGADLASGGPSASAGKGRDLFVAEVDESDGTHVCVHPFLGIVPNVESDHAWSVGGEAVLYENFRRFGAQSEHLVYAASPKCDELFRDHPAAIRLELPSSGFHYDRWFGFQAFDAALAVAAAGVLGIPEKQAQELLRDFGGVARRMCVRRQKGNIILIEDYAHHPTEVENAVAFLREAYPGAFLRLIFQPHRYARLAKYLNELAAALRPADEILVTPVFAAWSETGSVDSADLAAAIGPHAHLISADWSRNAALALRPAPEKSRPVVTAVLGAGDVEQIFTGLK